MRGEIIARSSLMGHTCIE